MRARSLAAALSGLTILAACDEPPTQAAPDKAAPVPTQTAPIAQTVQATAAATPSADTPAAADLPAPPDVAAPPADAARTPSGLASKALSKGTGKDHPGPLDKVKVRYTGWTKAGKMFGSSGAHDEPVAAGLNQVLKMKGWTEGVGLMVAGEKRRLWIPAALAYGDHPGMGAPAGNLVLDVELLEIVAPPKPPPVPEDVKAAPPSAKKTASGLAYRVLKKGTGTESPKGTSTVVVSYSGWTLDGKMFDSSITRGEPATFQLDQVIKGWTEGVQLMTVGDTMRFWIPGSLAYGDKPARPGTPSGTLVFDIELIAVK